MFSTPSILIISWDPITRSESEPFAWAERLVQHYKDLYPELYLDYIDLHQDYVDFNQDDTLVRLTQAQLVCVVINDDFAYLPKPIATILRTLSDYSWNQRYKFLFTKKAQPVCADWTLIDSQKKLTKELASLK